MSSLLLSKGAKLHKIPTRGSKMNRPLIPIRGSGKTPGPDFCLPGESPPITTGGRSRRGACLGRKHRKDRLEDLLAFLQAVTHLPVVRVGDLHQHIVDRLLHGLPQDELLGVGQGDYHGLTPFESAKVFRCRPIPSSFHKLIILPSARKDPPSASYRGAASV